MPLPQASNEQLNIIECVKNGRSCVGDAVAGSGKTTTVRWLAKSMPDKRIMQITYNKLLKEEVRNTVKADGLTNITIHNYHSIATVFYNPFAHKDDELKQVIDTDMEPRRDIPIIDIIVLDEVQDMTIAFCKLIKKFILDMIRYSVDDSSDNNNTQPKYPVMLFLGDHNQGINDFLGADIRFITKVQQIWPDVFPIMKMPLRTSYRVTRQIASFVNDCVLGHERLVAVKDGEPVTYIRNTRHAMHFPVAQEVFRLINSGVPPGDIFILMQSVRGKAIPALENHLVGAQIPVYVTKTNDEKVEQVLKGKLVITTFNQSKGRERPYVFVYGFDKSIYMVGNKSMDECPAVLYVALTRAIKKLYVCQDEENGELPFLKYSIEQMKGLDYMQVKDRFPGIPDRRNDRKLKTIPYHACSPTKLVEYLRDDITHQLMPLVDVVTKTIRDEVKGKIVDMPIIATNPTAEAPKEVINDNKKDNNNNDRKKEIDEDEELAVLLSKSALGPDVNPNLAELVTFLGGSLEEAPQEQRPNITRDSQAEFVSDLIGLAIPCMYEAKIKGKPSTVEEEILRFRRLSSKNSVLKHHLAALKIPCESIADYLYMCNVYSAINDGLLFRIEQLTSYDWLDQSSIDGCFEHMQGQIMPNTRFEETLALNDKLISRFVIDNFGDTIGKIQMEARIDAIDDTTVWEFKCVGELGMEHKLQMILYAWLWRYGPGAKYGKRMFKLINIRTGEIVLINHMSPVLEEIACLLLFNKYGPDNRLSDEDFMRKVLQA